MIFRTTKTGPTGLRSQILKTGGDPNSVGATASLFQQSGASLSAARSLGADLLTLLGQQFVFLGSAVALAAATGLHNTAGTPLPAGGQTPPTNEPVETVPMAEVKTAHKEALRWITQLEAELLRISKGYAGRGEVERTLRNAREELLVATGMLSEASSISVEPPTDLDGAVARRILSQIAQAFETSNLALPALELWGSLARTRTGISGIAEMWFNRGAEAPREFKRALAWELSRTEEFYRQAEQIGPLPESAQPAQELFATAIKGVVDVLKSQSEETTGNEAGDSFRAIRDQICSAIFAAIGALDEADKLLWKEVPPTTNRGTEITRPSQLLPALETLRTMELEYVARVVDEIVRFRLAHDDQPKQPSEQWLKKNLDQTASEISGTRGALWAGMGDSLQSVDFHRNHAMRRMQTVPLWMACSSLGVGRTILSAATTPEELRQTLEQTLSFVHQMDDQLPQELKDTLSREKILGATAELQALELNPQPGHPGMEAAREPVVRVFEEAIATLKGLLDKDS